MSCQTREHCRAQRVVAGRRNGTSPRAAGYSIVEVLAVSVLIGFAAMITINGVGGKVRRTQLECSFKEITHFLSSVPKEADLRHKSMFLLWDEQDRAFVISQGASDTDGFRRYRLPEMIHNASEITVPLRCDPQARTYLGMDSTMIESPVTFNLVHYRDSEPDIHYELAVTPLWSLVVNERLE